MSTESITESMIIRCELLEHRMEERDAEIEILKAIIAERKRVFDQLLIFANKLEEEAKERG